MNEPIDETYTFPSLCRYLPVNLTPGVHSNISRETYDSVPYLSSTVLKQWAKLGPVPSQFKYWLEHRWEEPQSEPLIIGSAVDCRILEPKTFEFRYATVPPDAPKRPTKAQVNAAKPSPETQRAVAFWNKFNEDNKGKVVLTNDQMTTVVKIEAALRKSRSTAGVFDNCSKEVLIAHLDAWPVKCEIDLFSEKTKYLLDIKTAQDVTPTGFVLAADRFGYFEQAAWYLQIANALGFKKTAFSWVVASTVEPYAVQVYTLDREIPDHNDILRAAELRLKKAKSGLVTALLEDIFEDDADWKPLVFPSWLQVRAQRELEETNL